MYFLDVNGCPVELNELWHGSFTYKRTGWWIDGHVWKIKTAEIWGSPASIRPTNKSDISPLSVFSFLLLVHKKHTGTQGHSEADPPWHHMLLLSKSGELCSRVSNQWESEMFSNRKLHPLYSFSSSCPLFNSWHYVRSWTQKYLSESMFLKWNIKFNTDLYNGQP